MIVGAAVGVLLGELQAIGSILRGARAALVLAVLGDEEPALEDVVIGGEADSVRVAIAPRVRLDRQLRVLGVEFRAQDGPVADARSRGALERLHRRAGSEGVVGREAAGDVSRRRREAVGAQRDVLTRN